MGVRTGRAAAFLPRRMRSARPDAPHQGGTLGLNFFHVRDDNAEMRDDEEQEFDSLADAEAHAHVVITELTRKTCSSGWNATGALIVVDAQGPKVIEMPLTEGASFQPKARPPIVSPTVLRFCLQQDGRMA